MQPACQRLQLYTRRIARIDPSQHPILICLALPSRRLRWGDTAHSRPVWVSVASSDWMFLDPRRQSPHTYQSTILTLHGGSFAAVVSPFYAILRYAVRLSSVASIPVSCVRVTVEPSSTFSQHDDSISDVQWWFLSRGLPVCTLPGQSRRLHQCKADVGKLQPRTQDTRTNARPHASRYTS